LKNDWFLWTGGNFGVDKDGKLYATEADISGKITATSGNIGNWEIGKPDPNAGSNSDGGKTAIYKRFE
jgi:hypothetical protein